SLQIAAVNENNVRSPFETGPISVKFDANHERRTYWLIIEPYLPARHETAGAARAETVIEVVVDFDAGPRPTDIAADVKAGPVEGRRWRGRRWRLHPHVGRLAGTTQAQRRQYGAGKDKIAIHFGPLCSLRQVWLLQNHGLAIANCDIHRTGS